MGIFWYPQINAMRIHVIENTTLPIFPSWTSRVRVPSPAPCFQPHSDFLPTRDPFLMETLSKTLAAKPLISKRLR